MSSPLWLLFAAAIRLEDGGPVLFPQERVGLHGCRFRALKFRSMRPDAEVDRRDRQAGKDDPRVTRVGRLLRATAMDELPQLCNISRRRHELRRSARAAAGRDRSRQRRPAGRLSTRMPGFARRHHVRPGLTGIAQIYAPRDVPRRQKFRFDCLYVRNARFSSMFVDSPVILDHVPGTWEVRARKL